MPFHDTSDPGEILSRLRLMEDPSIIAGRQLALKNEQNEQTMFPLRKQVVEMGVQEKQREIRENQQLRDVFASSPDVRSALPKVFAINPQVGLTMQKSLHEAEKSQLDIEKTKIENNAKKAERLGSIAGTIKDESSFHSGIAAAVGQGLIAPNQAAAMFEAGWNPQTQAQVQQFSQQALAVKDQHDQSLKDLEEKRKTIEFQHKEEMAPFELQEKKANARTAEAKSDVEVAQANALKSMTDADWQTAIDSIEPNKDSALHKRTVAEVQFYRQKGDLKSAADAIKRAGDQLGRTETAVATAKATAPIKIDVATAALAARAGAAGLTEDDYKMSGEIYGRTGVMPALGRDSVTRGKIEHYKNQWAKDNGFSAADLVVIQAAYAGDKNSYKQFKAQRDQIVSFEQTAQKNLDMMLEIGKKLSDTGSKWLNRPLRSINRNLLSTDEQAAFDAAELIARNEVAKVTSGGGLGGVVSDTAKREMEEAMGKDPTISNMIAVAKVLKRDMASRHQSMDATLSDIKLQIGGAGQPGGQAGGQQGGGQPGGQDAAGGHVIEINGKHYRYSGNGATNDLKNYTEIPNAR